MGLHKTIHYFHTMFERAQKTQEHRLPNAYSSGAAARGRFSLALAPPPYSPSPPHPPPIFSGTTPSLRDLQPSDADLDWSLCSRSTSASTWIHGVPDPDFRLTCFHKKEPSAGIFIIASHRSFQESAQYFCLRWVRRKNIRRRSVLHLSWKNICRPNVLHHRYVSAFAKLFCKIFIYNHKKYRSPWSGLKD